MRASRTLTISLPPELADEIDRVAAVEHRTRSELLREAFRRYLASEQRWQRVLLAGEQVVRAAGWETEAEIDAAVDAAVEEVRARRRRA